MPGARARGSPGRAPVDGEPVERERGAAGYAAAHVAGRRRIEALNLRMRA